MSKFVKFNSRQGVNQRNNLVDFNIPNDSSVYDLSKSYVDIVFNLEYAQSLSLGSNDDGSEGVALFQFGDSRNAEATVYNSTGFSNSSETLTYILAQRPGDISEQISGLSDTGTDIGGFLTNVAPGIGLFVVIISIFGSITFLIYAVVSVIKKNIK